MAARYDIFLSHNSQDKASVEYIARQILNEGFRPWLDKWDLPKGKTWQDGIELGLKNCRSCAVFLGPNGISDWQSEEIRIANRMRVERGRFESERQGEFTVVPVLLPGFPAAEGRNLPAVLTNTTWVQFSSLDDAEALRGLIAGILGESVGAGPESGAAQECPYRGLRYFDTGDAKFYFGREVLTDRVLAAIRPGEIEGRENRFVALVGSSGSGKSSLARAGLLARIQGGVYPGSNQWPVVILRPGPDPLESLATALFKTPGFMYGSKPGELIDDLAKSPKTLQLASSVLLRGGAAQRLVIFADQFEELFTQCESQAVRASFVANLLHACNTLGSQTVVVLAMRADFLGRCAEIDGLATALSQPGRQFLVGPMSEAELERAIELPARASGCKIEPQLIARLLEFSKGRQGSLPLLQDALYELWKNRVGAVMPLAAYREMGGAEGALGRRADSLYRGLDEEDKRVCERTFLRLVITSDAGSIVKRRVPVPELMPAGGSPLENQRVEHIIQRLAGDDARLIVTEAEADGAACSIELVHEALIDGWPLLKNWLEADRSFQFWRRRLEESKKEWIRLSRDRDLLLRGPALAEAVRWLGERSDDLNREEQEYIRASIQAQAEAESAERKRQQDLLDAEKQRADAQAKVAKRSKLLAIASAALALAAIAAGTISFVALRQATYASANRLAADARSQVTAKPEVAVLLALHAVHRNPSRVTLEALEYTMQWARRPLVELKQVGDPPEIKAFAYSPDGSLLASAHGDNNVRIWQVASGRMMDTVLPHPGKVQALSFSPKGDRIATACADGIARVWSIEGGRIEFEVPSAGSPLMDVDFSRDGASLALAYWNGVVRIWPIGASRALREYPAEHGPATTVSFNTSGDSLAAGYTDGVVLLLDSDIQHAKTLLKEKGQIADVRFSGTGSELAAASDAGAFVCDIAGGKAPRKIGADPSGAVAVAFSPAGKQIAVAGRGGAFGIFDAASGEERLRVAFDDSPLTGIAFQPGLKEESSEILAVAAINGTVRVYELNAERLTSMARDRVRGKVMLTSEQCTEYLGGKACSDLP